MLDNDKPLWFKVGNIRPKIRKSLGHYYTTFKREFCKKQFTNDHGTNVKVFSNFHVRCYYPNQNFPEFRIQIQISNGSGSAFCDPTLPEYDQLLKDLIAYRQEVAIAWQEAHNKSLDLLDRKQGLSELESYVLDLENPNNILDELVMSEYIKQNENAERKSMKSKFLSHVKDYLETKDFKKKSMHLEHMLRIIPGAHDKLMSFIATGDLQLLKEIIDAEFSIDNFDATCYNPEIILEDGEH